MMKITNINPYIKKSIVVMSILSFSAISNAGSMGPISSQPSYIPYITGEASYTWPNVGPVSLNGSQASLGLDGWGGRLGLGIAYPSSIQNMDFTAEIGGGYYGSVNRSLLPLASSKFNIEGYDVLAGALYKTTYNIDLFGQVGFMIQNVNASGNENITYNVPGGSQVWNSSEKFSSSQVLPEVKIGGIYNLTQNWGFSVAYMGVYGSRPGASVSDVLVGTQETTTQVINTKNPTLNSVMFGLRYSIV